MLVDTDKSDVQLKDELSELSSQFVISVSDRKLGFLGYLVIDRYGIGKSCGGIRMAHDLTGHEIAHLARSMTLKFGFINSWIGGAKAGIICPSNAKQEEKVKILKAFGENLAPMIKTLYTPGGDIGIGQKELNIIQNAAGVIPTQGLKNHSPGYFAAFGVFSCIKTYLKYIQQDMNNSSAVIEGFGSVGQNLAKFLYENGMKIKAISTIDGGLCDENGLDIPDLISAAEKGGDRFVGKYSKARFIPKAELFELAVDVLIPGARAWSIHLENVDTIKAKAIIPAANIPVTEAAAKILESRDIVYVPDFISTSGTILSSGLLERGFEIKDVLEILNTVYETKLARILSYSSANDVSIKSIALQIVNDNIERLNKLAELRSDKKRWLLTKINEGNIFSKLKYKLARSMYLGFIGKKIKIVRNKYRTQALQCVYNNLLRDIIYYPK